MGLRISHSCWDGPYSQFHRWREWIAEGYQINLGVMSGFTCVPSFLPFIGHLSKEDTINDSILEFIEKIKNIPVGWDFNDPIQILLSHSDCDGRIKWWHCKKLAVQLSEIARRKINHKDAFIRYWIDENGNHHPTKNRGCYDGMVPATLRFCQGLIQAYKAREDIIFR